MTENRGDSLADIAAVLDSFDEVYELAMTGLANTPDRDRAVEQEGMN